jgi:Domain of unknown function (DUF4136)
MTSHGTYSWPAIALLGAFLSIGPLGCTPAIEVHASIAPEARIPSYRTFAFALGDDPLMVGFVETARSLDVRQRIEAQTKGALEALGYVRADKPELLVRVSVGSRERRGSRPMLIPHAVPSRSTGWFIENEESDIAEGAFVIDMFDAGSNLLVFHGAARAEIDPEKLDVGRLQGAVARVLAFLPRRASPSLSSP